MLKAFFKMIPNEIEEAAYIDGASRLRILYSIILPLASPGIASIAIFCFIISWTEYMFASILISGDDMRTMPVGLASIVGQYQIDWGFLLAGATIASLPVIILFIFVGKYFVSGLTDGAIK
jgi:ABC-type glycerol-3-phosphate transport system permease component